MLLHVLFEHAAGYALFAVREVEEIGLLLPQVRDGTGRGGTGRGGAWRPRVPLRAVTAPAAGGGERPDRR